MAVLFFTLDEALAIHAHQIARYGGALGLRDWGLLASALAMPAATFGGEYFHLVKNRPYLDGNKRVGSACGLAFCA